MIKLNKIKKTTAVFLDEVEDGAMTQFVDTMNQPFITRGAMMPDAHQGYTLPIGGVVETDGMVMPSYVGFDIGCGMCAVPTNFSIDDIRDNDQKIYNQIVRDVPLGFNKHKSAVSEIAFLGPMSHVMAKIWGEKSGHLQMGTLGGGNHFIEIGYDEGQNVWIIVHSGSRGVGHGCATHYMKAASPTGKASEGHYGFDVNSVLGKGYIEDMNWCLEFALLNRQAMIGLVEKGIRQCGIEGGAHYNSLINRNHNHAESKDGRYWIHRKGATHAENGMLGVIPGNMRDGSFIVRGKGNEEALCSSSHGAGRVLGRRKAKETLDIDEFTLIMDGIVSNVSPSTLDESPMAYKNIFEVMRLQEDLVEVVTYVKPIINVKG